MNIDKRLEDMRERLERSKPVLMTATLTDGSQITTNPGEAIDLCRERGGDVVSITANRPEYQAEAEILAVLCHPVPNRRLADYE